jgi:myosin heavy subunit
VKQLKKLISYQELNKFAKGAFAIALAGSFLFPSSNAFANEVIGINDEIHSTEFQAESGAEKAEVQGANRQESPTLLPGDFFYFAKIAFEKIQLALTIDDVKEAMLLASFSSERLAEMERLFVDGDEAAALEVMKAALKDMEIADMLLFEQPDVNQPSIEVTTDDEVSGGDQEGQAETSVKEVNKVLSQNIIALTAAMEKVKNPVAKAALQKNIDKSYLRLAKKMERSEKKLVKKQEKESKRLLKEEQTANDENETTTVMEATSEESSRDLIDQDSTIAETSEELISGEEVQAIQKAAHQEFKKTQAVGKQQRKESKEQVKEKKQEVKQTKQAGSKEINGKSKNR